MSSYLLTAAMMVGIVFIGLASTRHSKWPGVALLALAVLAPAVFYATV